MSRPISYLLALVGLALPGAAVAQTFPADNAYVPLTCGNAPMIDPANDTPNATGPLDLVGTPAQPAGFHAADAQFLYLRMRLAATPFKNPRLDADAWGYEIDLDGDRTTYEVLISVSGTGATDQVAIFRHPTTATPDSPADPAVMPPAFSYPFTTHGQVSNASSSLGGGADTFIDLAVPWSDLAAVGIQRDTSVYVWAGSSTVANALNLDLACFAGAGGALSAIDVGRTTPDPAASGGGGAGGAGGAGGGAGGSGGRTLEGGPGCAMGGEFSGAPLGTLALVAMAVCALFCSRRRKRH